MAESSSRRDFLAGLAPGNQPGSPPSSLPQTYLVHVTRKAMASEFEVVLNAGPDDVATEAAIAALDRVQELEEHLSFFRATSAISRINREAHLAPVALEPWLFDLLALAGQLHLQTAGAYDITATPLWELWGFSRREGRLPSEAELAEARKSVGGHLVELDPQHQTVRLAHPGVRLSLGSVGKGYALDRAAEALEAAGVGDFLLHGGLSSMLARGSKAGGVGWQVAIRDPLRPQQRLLEIRLGNRALGTSGSAFQFFRHQGRRYGHILDPRTGWPAEGVHLVSVLAPTAALADALSTAFYVMGVEAAGAFCRDRPELAAVFLTPARGRPGSQLTAMGLANDEYRLL